MLKSDVLCCLNNISTMIGVVGTRYPEDVLPYPKFAAHLDSLIKTVHSLVSGGASGVDSYVKQYATERKIPLIEYPVTKEMYTKYGKRAPLERNILIAQTCSLLIAFPRETGPLKSRGTYDTITKAQKLGKPVIVITV